MIPLMKVFTPPRMSEKLNEVFESGFLTEGEYSDEIWNHFKEYFIETTTINIVSPGAGKPSKYFFDPCLPIVNLANRNILNKAIIRDAEIATRLSILYLKLICILLSNRSRAGPRAIS